MLSWYLVHTKPLSELIAQANLQRQGYEVYLPRAIQTIRHCGRWRDRIVALFPQYLFLGLNEGVQALNPVRSTIGVAGIVRFGMRYTLVPDHVISDLRTLADPVSGLHRLTCHSKLTRGTPVQLTSGPFEGLEAIFERAAGVDRVVVLLKLLGQRASVCVPIEVVRQAI
jgi:transcriptional antiterminator RfaH